MTINTHECKVCKEEYRNPDTEAFICPNCEEEYSNWLEANGLVIGEFDTKSHPNYQPNVHKGTKWECLND